MISKLIENLKIVLFFLLPVLIYLIRSIISDHKNYKNEFIYHTEISYICSNIYYTRRCLVKTNIAAKYTGTCTIINDIRY